MTDIQIKTTSAVTRDSHKLGNDKAEPQVIVIEMHTYARITIEGKAYDLTPDYTDGNWDRVLTVVSGKPVVVSKVDRHAINLTVTLGSDFVPTRLVEPHQFTAVEIQAFINRVRVRVNLMGLAKTYDTLMAPPN